MPTITHPVSGATIEGIRIVPGQAIQEGDKYDSTDGKWRNCSSVVGNEIQPGCETIWVREVGELSDGARDLLTHLSHYDLSIGVRHGNFKIIPTPDFNWDGRIDWPVRDPEFVKELVDHGFLQFGEHRANNWASQYSTVWAGHVNEVFTLTESGREESARLLE